MASRLDIVNAALAHLDERPVDTLEGDELRGNAAKAARIYPILRDEMLSAFPWSWLIERKRLARAPLDEGEQPPFPNKFQVPTLNVRSIRAVYSSLNALEPDVDAWTQQGAFLYAAFPNAWVEDQRKVVEEAFPDLFVSALTMTLTSRLAPSITEDIPSANWWKGQADMVLADAKRVDSQSKPTQVLPHFEFVEARVGYGRRGLRGRDAYRWDQAPGEAVS